MSATDELLVSSDNEVILRLIDVIEELIAENRELRKVPYITSPNVTYTNLTPPFKVTSTSDVTGGGAI